MKAILTTVCGCMKTIEMPKYEARYYVVPIHVGRNHVANKWYDSYQSSYTTRRFEYDGQDFDGQMILRERLENLLPTNSCSHCASLQKKYYELYRRVYLKVDDDL